MSLQSLLYQANEFRFFTYLYGNSIPYLHGNFGEHLAYGNKNNLDTLEELNNQIGTKTLFGHFSYDLKNQLENLSSKNPDHVLFPDLHFF